MVIVSKLQLVCAAGGKPTGEFMASHALSRLNGVAGVGHHDGACVPGFENGGRGDPTGVSGHWCFWPLVFLATGVSGHWCFWPLGESDFLTLRCRAVNAFRAGNHWSCSLGLPYFANKRRCSDIISFCVMF